MNGFPECVDEPVGPWLKKVREAVASVSVGDSRERVVEFLDPPDEVRHDSANAGEQLQSLLEIAAGGDTLIQHGDKDPFPETLVYRDPYRPRRRYAFRHARWRGSQHVAGNRLHGLEGLMSHGPSPDPRDPRWVFFVTMVILIVLGWFIWVLVNWPDSVVFHQT